MNFRGNYQFYEKAEKVWNYLNNPEILKKCIDGCEEFIEKEDNNYILKIKVKIGPVNATFTGNLILKDIRPPNSYTIEAKGNAGQLGGASGKVKIKLMEKNNITQLDYEANTKINGKIVQLGSRLIDGTVKKNTTMFFNNFNSFLNEKNYINIDALENNHVAKQLHNGKNFKNKYTYLYVLFIFFFIIIFVFIRYE